MHRLPPSLLVVVLLLLGPASLRTPCADEETPTERMRATSARFFAQYDRDGDGRLSREEYPAFLRFAFRRADADGDGYVTPAEDLASRVAFRKEVGPRRPGAGIRRVPEGVTVHADLAYAEVDGTTLRLDLFLPKSSTNRPPLFVWIHGGGWTRGSRKGVNPLVLRLAGEGYATASIDYRLGGLASHPKQIHDCKGAVRWLRAHAGEYGYDASRVAVGGGSAGGHLSLLLGLSSGVEALEGTVGGNTGVSSGVEAIVDLYGPGDFLLFRKSSARFARRAPEDLLRAATPLAYLTADDPPVLILHGDRDPVVPLSQSREVHRRYREAGLTSTLHVLEGAGHGGKQFSDDERFLLVKSFLDRHLRTGSESTPRQPTPAVPPAEGGRR